MEQSERYPSYITSVANALSTSSQPLSVDALVDKVRGQRPIGKGVRSAVYRALKQLYQAVPVGHGQYGWLSHLLRDNVFRHPLTNDEVRRGFLLLDELEHAVFFPQFFQTHRPDSRRLSIELYNGPTLEAEAAVERRTWSLRMGAPLAEWIDEIGGQGRDDLIITVLDAHAGQYLVRLQPREARDEDAVRDRSLLIAMAAEDLVADSRRSGKPMPTWELAALLIGRGMFLDPVPPDDLHLALQRYSMLALTNGQGYMLKDPHDVGSPSKTSRAAFPPAIPDGDRERRPDRQPWTSSEGEQDVMNYEPDFFGDDDSDSCQDYEDYLEQHEEAGAKGEPLAHGDYHLLEAELEMLIGLEQEFGYLLPDQSHRVDELAERLFIDADALRKLVEEESEEDDDLDGPAFWQN